MTRSATPISSSYNPSLYNVIPEMSLPPAIQVVDVSEKLGRFGAYDMISRQGPCLATLSHLWIPGAPPASKPLTTAPPTESSVPKLATIPPTPDPNTTSFPSLDKDEPDALLLPDSSWIAIVCGVSKDQWIVQGDDNDQDMPDGFYVAPKDVYMPNLTAVGDVLLGKLVSLHTFIKVLHILSWPAAWRFHDI